MYRLDEMVRLHCSRRYLLVDGRWSVGRRGCFGGTVIGIDREDIVASLLAECAVCPIVCPLIRRLFFERLPDVNVYSLPSSIVQVRMHQIHVHAFAIVALTMLFR